MKSCTNDTLLWNLIKGCLTAFSVIPLPYLADFPLSLYFVYDIVFEWQSVYGMYLVISDRVWYLTYCTRKEYFVLVPFGKTLCWRQGHVWTGGIWCGGILHDQRKYDHVSDDIWEISWYEFYWSAIHTSY